MDSVLTKSCPLCRFQKAVGGKWKPYLLCLLSDKTMRFNEIYKVTPGITQAMLTRQLRELEETGIVFRNAYPEIPPKVEYSLTERGASILPVLKSMAEWSQANLTESVQNA
ncbi:MAG: helix-turn-helix domain-containing protein [Methanocorpusculum sp.]|nr:helix-turn-helix domain-containing protein [Methanocorpusculum sp.]